MVLLENSSLPRYFSSHLTLALLNFSNPFKKGLSAIRDLNRNQGTFQCPLLEFDYNGLVTSSCRALFHFLASRILVSMEYCIFNFPDVFFVKFTGMAISVNTIHCSVEWYWTWISVSSFKEHYNKAMRYGAEWCSALFQETSVNFKAMCINIAYVAFWMKLVSS